MKRLFLMLLLPVLSAGALGACNTTKGFAEDLQKVGEEVEEAADKTGATEPG